MEKVIFDTLNLGPHLPRLVAEKSIADFVATKMIDMYLAAQKPRWAEMGIPQSAQDFIESLLRSAVVGSLAGGVSLVLKFCRFSDKPTPEEAQRNSAAIQALHEENQAFTSKARTIDVLTKAARSDSQPSSASAPDSPSEPVEAPSTSRTEGVVINAGDEPIGDICNAFVAALVRKQMLNQAQADELRPNFYGAMLTCAWNMHNAATAGNADARARSVFLRMVDEAQRKAGPGSGAKLEAAARNVH